MITLQKKVLSMNILELEATTVMMLAHLYHCKYPDNSPVQILISLLEPVFGPMVINIGSCGRFFIKHQASKNAVNNLFDFFHQQLEYGTN